MNVIDYKFEYFISVLGTLLVIFNGLQIFMIYKNKKGRKSFSPLLLLILNQAISNLVTGVLLLLLRVMYAFYDKNTFHHTNTLWKLIVIFESLTIRLSLLVSSLTLVVLTTFKVFTVTKPFFKWSLQHHVTLRLVYATWLLSLTFVSIYYFAFRFYFQAKEHETYEKVIIPIFMLASFVVYLTGFYMIYTALYSHRRSMAYYSQTMSSNGSNLSCMQFVNRANMYTESSTEATEMVVLPQQRIHTNQTNGLNCSNQGFHRKLSAVSSVKSWQTSRTLLSTIKPIALPVYDDIDEDIQIHYSTGERKTSFDKNSLASFSLAQSTIKVSSEHREVSKLPSEHLEVSRKTSIQPSYHTIYEMQQRADENEGPSGNEKVEKKPSRTLPTSSSPVEQSVQSWLVSVQTREESSSGNHSPAPQVKQGLCKSVSFTLANTAEETNDNKAKYRLQVDELFDVKVIRLVRNFVVIFLLCWTPLSIIIILNVSGYKLNNFADIEEYCTGVALCQGLLTPLVYIVSCRSHLYKPTCIQWKRKSSVEDDDEFVYTNHIAGTVATLTTFI